MTASRGVGNTGRRNASSNEPVLAVEFPNASLALPDVVVDRYDDSSTAVPTVVTDEFLAALKSCPFLPVPLSSRESSRVQLLSITTDFTRDYNRIGAESRKVDGSTRPQAASPLFRSAARSATNGRAIEGPSTQPGCMQRSAR